jgi:beta-lactamase class A
VFKVPIAVAYARAVAAGQLDPTQPVRVTAADRSGGVGTAGCADDVEMSWRDLALFMISMSDNGATDVVLRRVTLAAVQEVLDDLGLTAIRVAGGCADLFATILGELGIGGPAELAGVPPERLWALSALDPSRALHSGTPREVTALLAAIWRDDAGPPDACSAVRSMMRRQIWPIRLAAGFRDGIEVASKTGTLLAVRNDAGVVTLSDGTQYAVAVFTRADSLAERRPDIDAAIGTAACLAVEHLRDQR